MLKTLPVFGPENESESPMLPVFGQADVPETPCSMPIWAPCEPTAVLSIAIFCPMPELTDAPQPITAYPALSPGLSRHTQGQREIDLIVRRFLLKIKAQDIRIRRVGPVTYTWKHVTDPLPGDTGSDVRWEIKTSGLNIHMGCYDIKPFFRVLSGPFDIEKLFGVYQQLRREMDLDAGE